MSGDASSPRTRPPAGTTENAKPTEEGWLYVHYVEPGRATEAEKAAEAAKRGADGIMSRVRRGSLLGSMSSPLLRSPHVITLVTVEHYVDFKEGEVWEDTQKMFAEEGMVPTGPDRQAIAEAIATAQATAGQLADNQRAMVAAQLAEQSAAEEVYYEDMRRQQSAEAEARMYKKDRSSLTMKERLRRNSKEEMLPGRLPNSPRGLSF